MPRSAIVTNWMRLALRMLFKETYSMKQTVPLENLVAEAGVSRRRVIQRVSEGAFSAAAVSLLLAQTDSSHESAAEDFVHLMTQLSNWNRWGKDGQLGAINLKKKARVRVGSGDVLLVRTGRWARR